jgi:hypothetical protein
MYCRTNFTQTWLAVNVIGSFAVAPDINFPRTLVKARPDLKTKL